MNTLSVESFGNIRALEMLATPSKIPRCRDGCEKHEEYRRIVYVFKWCQLKIGVVEGSYLLIDDAVGYIDSGLDEMPRTRIPQRRAAPLTM